jgi:hypothetical protein
VNFMMQTSGSGRSGQAVARAGWGTLHSPEVQAFYGKTLEEALAWCLVWLKVPEIGVGPFMVRDADVRWARGASLLSAEDPYRRLKVAQPKMVVRPVEIRARSYSIPYRRR